MSRMLFSMMVAAANLTVGIFIGMHIGRQEMLDVFAKVNQAQEVAFSNVVFHGTAQESKIGWATAENTPLGVLITASVKVGYGNAKKGTVE